MTGSEILVRRLGPADYFAAPSAWDELVAAAGVDPLFMGHAWQKCWWEAFGERNHLEPVLLEARVKGKLVGLLSLVRSRSRVLCIPVRTLQFLGRLVRGAATVRTEFLDAVITPTLRDEVAFALLDWLEADRDWDEWLLSDLAQGGTLDGVLDQHPLGGVYQRASGPEKSHEVHIEGRFADYKAQLSAGARRRMFGQRRRLEGIGPLRLKEASFSSATACQVLDELHRKRWGSPLLGGGRFEFFRALESLLPHGGLYISTLYVGDRPVSALLNVRQDRRDTNIQGGFDAGTCPGTSPSRLHWGLLIEEAFARGTPQIYDLLLGRGRREDFKEDFCVPSRSCVHRHVVRHKLLATSYRAREVFRDRLAEQRP